MLTIASIGLLLIALAALGLIRVVRRRQADRQPPMDSRRIESEVYEHLYGRASEVRAGSASGADQRSRNGDEQTHDEPAQPVAPEESDVE